MEITLFLMLWKGSSLLFLVFQQLFLVSSHQIKNMLRKFSSFIVTSQFRYVHIYHYTINFSINYINHDYGLIRFFTLIRQEYKLKETKRVFGWDLLEGQNLTSALSQNFWLRRSFWLIQSLNFKPFLAVFARRVFESFHNLINRWRLNSAIEPKKWLDGIRCKKARQDFNPFRNHAI